MVRLYYWSDEDEQVKGKEFDTVEDMEEFLSDTGVKVRLIKHKEHDNYDYC